MSRKDWTKVAVVLAVVTLVASACGKSNDKGGGAFKSGGVYRLQAEGFEWNDGLDPTGEYLGFAWEFFAAMHRPLIGYNHKSGRQGGNNTIADAATNTGDVSADGLTWTFKIKKGIRFSPPVNREVTSRDYVTAFKRLASKTLGAQYANYYDDEIVGFKDYTDGKATEIAGITTPDTSTIIFKLTRGVGDFRYRLALPATAPIPEEVSKCATKPAQYGRFQIASGPYMIEGTDKLKITSCDALIKGPASGFNPETHLRLVRNPKYNAGTDTKESRENFVEGIDLTKNTNGEDIFRRIEAGTLEGESADPPPAFVAKGLTDPKFKDNYHLDPGDRTWYISLNLVAPPFDDVHVRKAVNWVLDKAELAKIRGNGRAGGVVAEHIVPPDVLGGQLKSGEFDPYASPGHAGDVVKAKAEMKLSKYDSNRDGLCDAKVCKKILHLTRSTGNFPNLVPVVEKGLAKIGITLESRPIATFYKTVQVTTQTPPITSGAGWGKDYADASTFFEPLLSGASIVNRDLTQNFSLLGLTKARATAFGVKVPAGLQILSADADIQRCAKLLDQQRRQCWAELDKKMMTDYLPWVPYLWANNTSVVSDAVLNYTYDQFAGEVSFVHIAIDKSKVRQG